MVDPIGLKGSTPADRIVAPVTVVAAVAKTVPVAAEPHPQETQTTTSAGQLASELASKPPIDMDRVTRIKKAIADGTFPILPATIADQLLALKMNWVPNDEA
jgi:negative regulator of flagellin synthesis FlgM